MAQKRGHGAGKKVCGRKRYDAVDTDDRLLIVSLTTANLSGSAGMQVIVAAIFKRWPWLKNPFADGALTRTPPSEAECCGGGLRVSILILAVGGQDQEQPHI